MFIVLNLKKTCQCSVKNSILRRFLFMINSCDLEKTKKAMISVFDEHEQKNRQKFHESSFGISCVAMRLLLLV